VNGLRAQAAAVAERCREPLLTLASVLSDTAPDALRRRTGEALLRAVLPWADTELLRFFGCAAGTGQA